MLKRLSLLLLILTSLSYAALTTITDTIYIGDGSLFTGSILVKAQGFKTAGNVTIGPTYKRFTITSGALNIQLHSVQGATPSGVSYRVEYYISGSALPIRVEYWTPQDATPVTVPTIVVFVQPTPAYTISLSNLAQGAATGTNTMDMRWSGSVWAAATLFNSTVATSLGVPTAGTSTVASRLDHIHGMASTINNQTGTTYTVLDGDRGKTITHSNAGAIAVTLPQAGGGGSFAAGWLAWFSNRGAGTVTITPTTSTINGSATLTLVTSSGAMVVSDGTNYFAVLGGAGSGDFSSNTATSVDSEIVLFSGTAGKTGKRATGTGLVRTASGVLANLAVTDDTIPVNNGTVPELKTLPDCDDTVGQHLNYDTTANTWTCGTSIPASGGTLFTSTAAATVGNTGTEGTLIGSGVGSLTLPVNYYTAGKSLRFIAGGYYSTDLTPGTLRIRFKHGSTVILDTGEVTPTSSLVNIVWLVECLVTARTTGGSGTVIAQCGFLANTAATLVSQWQMVNTSTVTIDTAATQVVDLTADWQTADTDNTITGSNFAMWTAGSGGGSGGNSTTTGTYGSNPGTCTDGDVRFPSDSFYLLRCVSNAWVPWGPLFPMVQPVSGDFAWINQGSATVTTTNGGIFLTSPAAGGPNLRVRKKAVPSAPYTVTIGIIPLMTTVSNAAQGIVLRESGSGKLVGCNLSQDAEIRMSKYDSPTAFSSHYSSNGGIRYSGGLLWLRFTDDNTNRKCWISMDGINFWQVSTIGRTDFITPDEIGFFVNNENATYDVATTLLSWKQE